MRRADPRQRQGEAEEAEEVGARNQGGKSRNRRSRSLVGSSLLPHSCRRAQQAPPRTAQRAGASRRHPPQSRARVGRARVAVPMARVGQDREDPHPASKGGGAKCLVGGGAPLQVGLTFSTTGTGAGGGAVPLVHPGAHRLLPVLPPQGKGGT